MTRILLACSCAVLSFASTTPGLAQSPAESRIVVEGLDGDPGTSLQPVESPIAGGTQFEIGEAQGDRPGGGVNLLQSFEDFQLATGDRALFSADPGLTTENIIARVTGGVESQIWGQIATNVDGASLYFLNPAGIFFGETASLDVQGSFHASTAEVLRMVDGMGVERLAFSGDAALAFATPSAFGFLDAQTGAITLDGAVLDVSAELDESIDPPDRDLSLVGGSIALRNGASVRGETGRGALVAVAAVGDLDLATLDASGFAERADITLDDFGVGLRGQIGAFTGFDPEGRIVLRGRALSATEGTIGGNGDITSIDLDFSGEVELTDVSIRAGFADTTVAGDAIALLRSSISTETNHPFTQRRPGSIEITSQRGVRLVESSVQSSNFFSILDGFGSFRGTGVALDAGMGAIEIIDSSLASAGSNARSVTIAGGTSFTMIRSSIDHSGSMGIGSLPTMSAITIVDSSFSTQPSDPTSGASFSGGFGFTADVVDISGIDVSLGNGSVPSTASLAVGGRVVRVREADVSIRGGGGLSLAASESLAVSGLRVRAQAGRSIDGRPVRGGTIRLEAPLLELAALDIDASGGFDEVAPGNIDVSGGRVTLSDSQLRVSGAVEAPIRLAASESLRVERTTLSAENDESFPPEVATTGGSIELSAPQLILSGSTVTTASSSSFNPDGGPIGLSGERITIEDSRIETVSLETGGGTITVDAARRLDIADSRLLTSVATGGGGGGDIVLSGGSALTINGAAVQANADAGDGGNVTISAGVALISADTLVTATSNTGIDGEIVRNAPEVDLSSGLQQLDTSFLDASRLVRPACEVAQASEGGSFVVAARPGLPSSPDELLASFDAGGGEADAAELQLALNLVGSDALRSARAGLRAAESQQAEGQYAASLGLLRGSLADAERAGDPGAIASALDGLGNAQLALGRGEEARASLRRGLAIAEEGDEPAIAAELWNDLGNANAISGLHAEAIEAYAKAAELAFAQERPAMGARALANAGRAALEGGDVPRAVAYLQRGEGGLRTRGMSVAPTALKIHIAHSWTEIARRDPAIRREALRAAHGLLVSARDRALESGDDRQLAFALGQLGSLYLEEERLDEALWLTRRALRAARRAEASDSLYRWHWQEGRILVRRGEPAAAIPSFRAAVQILEETRQVALARYGSAEVSFRQRVAPVYLDLVDALIADSERRSAPEQALREARDTMELFRAAELRNYFQSECLAELSARRTELDSVGDDAVVVYPIIFDDRVELLVGRSGHTRRYTSPVPRAQLVDVVTRFRSALMSPISRDYRPLAEALYDWLVRPYAAQLDGVSTLVFVPGGVLRTIPMAAVHDGERFLLERFATAVTPSLSLIDPRPIAARDIRVLAAGVSESVQGFPALPGVPRELAGVAELYPTEVLLDEEFELGRFAEGVTRGRPNVVHIASHGLFTGDPQESFLLAHGEKLTMDRLAEVVGETRFRDDALELLVLSACETAAGDERSALGLAGVAIRAGARSAMGSLWSIADEAAYRLVLDFYARLRQPGVSRAEALQGAQQALLASERFAHPFYWSPFLMINNWL